MNGAPSRLHCVAVVPAVPSKENCTAPEATVPDGPAVTVVSGGTVSIRIEPQAGVGSGEPTSLIARTSNVWSPSFSGAVVWMFAPEHSSKGAESTRHSKVTPGSSEENSKVTVGSLEVDGGNSSSVVSGALLLAKIGTESSSSAAPKSCRPSGAIARLRTTPNPEAIPPAVAVAVAVQASLSVGPDSVSPDRHESQATVPSETSRSKVVTAASPAAAAWTLLPSGLTARDCKPSMPLLSPTVVAGGTWVQVAGPIRTSPVRHSTAVRSPLTESRPKWRRVALSCEPA